MNYHQFAVWDDPQFDPNLNPGFDPNFEFDPITLSPVIVLMITTAEDDVSISWASNRKNILLAGIVNPANFKSKEVYSLFTRWRDTEQSINQTYNV